MKKKTIIVVTLLWLCSMLVTACAGDDTYKLAKKIHEYELNGTGYEETLKMARAGHYDANCRDCFRGIDTGNISLFAYACKVDLNIAKAIYDNGADIEISNSEFEQTPLLAALDGNRNNPEIAYWLMEQGADINAIDYDNCSVFNHMRFWEDNEENRALINYFKSNCDMQYLKENTANNPFCSWEKMWDEEGEFVFYEP